jgi:hypothetical protein
MVFPVPHLSRQSPRLKGRVVDAASGNPIQGASVQVLNRGDAHGDLYAGAIAKTKANGEFRLGATYNLHLLYYCNPSFQFSLPLGSYWKGELRVTHAGYASLSYSVVDVEKREAPVAVGDLRLVPKTSTP